jgi:hypothetical protein
VGELDSTRADGIRGDKTMVIRISIQKLVFVGVQSDGSLGSILSIPGNHPTHDVSTFHFIMVLEDRQPQNLSFERLSSIRSFLFKNQAACSTHFRRTSEVPNLLRTAFFSLPISYL